MRPRHFWPSKLNAAYQLCTKPPVCAAYLEVQNSVCVLRGFKHLAGHDDCSWQALLDFTCLR